MNVDELGLTPSQLVELEQLDGVLVDAWLAALDRVGTKVHSPVGWFLSGVRSGNPPGSVAEPERQQRTRLAERWVRNSGLYEPDEPSLVDALFGEHGRLRMLAAETELQARMVALWRHELPRAERAEHERLERAERWKAAQAKLNAVHAPYTHAPQPLSLSQTTHTQADTQSAGIDVDADIAW